MSLLVVVFLTFPSGSIGAIRSMRMPAEEIRHHFAGEASAWIRLQNFKYGSVATLGEARLYYLLPVGAVRIWDYPDLDRDLAKEKSILGMGMAIKKRGIDYLLVTSVLFDQIQDFDRWALFVKASSRYPEINVFSNDNSRVISLDKLIERFKKLETEKTN